jgi:hypothetical protein
MPISIIGESGSLPIAPMSTPSAARGSGAVGSVERKPPGVMRERPATMVPVAFISKRSPRRTSTPLSIQFAARPTSTLRVEKRASSSERPSISMRSI